MSEEWRPVVGWEGLYEVSDLGRVRSLDRVSGGVRPRRVVGRVLSPNRTTAGYLQVQPCRDGVKQPLSLSRAVCEAHVGPPPSDHHQVAHWNGDRTDNRAANLRWATRLENEADKERHGTVRRGEEHPSAKFPDDVVVEAGRLYASGMTMKAVGAALGVSAVHVGQLLRRERRSGPLKGASIWTSTGRRVDFINPALDGITLIEIAGPLSRIPRFAAQPTQFFSVLDHSLHVYRIVKGSGPDVELAALTHDMAESVCGDMPTPLKKLFPLFRKIEREMLREMLRAIGAPPDLISGAVANSVHRADRRALVGEASALGVIGPSEESQTYWARMRRTYGTSAHYIDPLPAPVAIRAFCELVERLLPLVQR